MVRMLILAALIGSAVTAALADKTSGRTGAAYKIVKSIPLKRTFGTDSDWTATAYQPLGPEADIGDKPAKLCFSRPNDKNDGCTKITSARPNSASFTYNYQTVKRFDIVSLKAGVRAIAFQAEFYGGGSGSAEQVSLWTYHRGSDFFYPALIISSNESLQYKIIDTGPLAGYVITGDAVWQSGEAHFSAHQFDVSVYRLLHDSYLKVLTYLTTRKYAGADQGGEDAIGPEMDRIRALLKAVGQ